MLAGLDVPHRIAGSGPPVVLVHGLGATRRIWWRLQERLSSELTVISYDLRGSGECREQPGASRELSLATWTDDLHCLIRALELDRPALVGHSLGASIAIKAALEWRDEVDSLVLMGADPDLSRLGPRMRKASNLIETLGMERWVEEHWSRNTPFAEASLEREPGLLDEYRAMVLANAPDDYIRTCLAIATADTLTPDLCRLAQPCLVIVGGADDRTLPSAGRELVASLPNASYLELPSVGHTMPLEAPDEVAGAIIEFLGAGRLAGESRS